MGKQTKSKKAEAVIGKGKVTPVQVAFIVDRYLSDNNFVLTRSSFRTEASHLISRSPVNEAPKSLLSLGDMLDEYICLKEQKHFLHQEKSRMEQEKFRVQTLLRGMQDVINAYTSSPFLKPPPIPPPVNNTPALIPTSKPLPDSSTFTTPIASTSTTQPTLKRRKTAPLASSKRTRSQPSVKPPSTNQSNTLQLTPSVAKCLFNPAPQTPSPSPTVLPADDNQTPPPPLFTSTNRTVITSETIQVSPMKQVSYYSIQRDHCITSPVKTSSKRFTTTRDHVKGRLDFDATSDENTESPAQPDAFDFDFPNLDLLGPDFNFTDLLCDFDIGADCFYQPDNNGSSPEPLSGSPDTMVDGSSSAGDHEHLSGMSSTLTQIRSEQGFNVADAGPNSVTSVKSITKCIKVFSPVKSRNP